MNEDFTREYKNCMGPFDDEWLESLKPYLEKVCVWTHHRSYGGDYTECGEWFYLTHEWTKKFKFCPYCGGRISLASKEEGGE